jgi:hypothetical protein
MHRASPPTSLRTGNSAWSLAPALCRRRALAPNSHVCPPERAIESFQALPCHLPYR